jgi:hypothetical protein
MQEPLPPQIFKWSQWAASKQKVDETYANQFGMLNAKLAGIRAAIKYKKVTSVAVIRSMMGPIDEEFKDWVKNLPASWTPKSYCLLNEPKSQSIEEELDSRFDVYPDLWIGSMWNNYRNVRIVIHETILAIAIKYGSANEVADVEPSANVLREMSAGICHSVAFFLGKHHGRVPMSAFSADNAAATDPIPGGYLLVWPLYFAGMLRNTPKAQRMWVAGKLKYIALTMGLKLAHSLATALETQEEKSFSDSEVWMIGEFRPQ